MRITKLFSTLVVGSIVFLCFTALTTMQSLHAATPIPAVTGPIPVTADSYPFGSAVRTNLPQDLSKFGYVEEEYFVSGFANVYDFDTNGSVIIKTANAPYTTRILVRRPISAKEFSGAVIMELLNPTAMYDLDLQWQFSRDYFLAHNDVWVGITIKPVAAKALKTFNPQRYAPISWANPLPADQTCSNPISLLPDTTPATENGLAWDITSQVGTLLKSTLAQNPLNGFPVKRVYLTGYSQTAGYLVTYINFIRPTATLANGKPIYDGYLIGDGDALPPSLNQCSARIKPGDPCFVIQPRPEPVISVGSQSLLGISIAARRADNDSPQDRYRRYEVPGASHINQRGVSLSPMPEDAAKAGISVPPPNCTEIATYGLTDFPFEYLMNGAFANLDAWVQSGTPPPKSPRINTKTVPGVPFPVAELDQYGNALGGVRTPYVDVPIATYRASSTPADPMFTLFCSLSGYKVPLEKEVLRQLYPTHDSFVEKVNQKVDALERERLLTRADGQKIKKEAADAAVP
ncbi:MAG: alpha/beta hydrolase domain-containing protein [Thermodesulfobacteriota bacterium]|jgi:hypothetical protein